MNIAGVTLRAGTSTDVSSVIDLERSSFATDRLSTRSIRHLLGSQSALLLVADHCGVIAGVLIMLFRKGSDKGRVYSLAIEKTYWGKNLATAMLHHAECHAIKRGIGGIRLEVRDDNHRAAAFYAKSGYRPLRRIPNYYADGTAAVRYEKSISG